MKNATGGDATFDYTLDEDAFASITTVGGTGSTNNIGVDGDTTFNLAEVVPEGWQLDGATCDNGDSPSSLIVGAAITVVCTFNNSVSVEAPQPQVIKGASDGNDTVAMVDEPGGQVTIDVIVFNVAALGPGDATLTALSDDIYGDVTSTGHDGITTTTCAIGGVIVGGGSYTCSFTVDVSSGPGSIVDTITATLANDAATVLDDDQANVVVTDILPSISVAKDNDANGDSTFSDSEQYDGTGDVSFQVVVTNNTAEELTLDSISDDVHTVALTDCSSTTIPASGSVTCTFTGPAPSGDNASEIDTVTVSASDDDGNSTGPVSDSSTVTTADIQPSISVDKTADRTLVVAPGEDVTFTVVVTNESSPTDPVTIDSLTDSIHGDLNGQGDCSVPQIIQPGTSYTCSFTVLVDGDETDVVTARGTDDEGNPVSGSDDATVQMINPAIAIKKYTKVQVSGGADVCAELGGKPTQITLRYSGDIPPIPPGIFGEGNSQHKFVFSVNEETGTQTVTILVGSGLVADPTTVAVGQTFTVSTTSGGTMGSSTARRCQPRRSWARTPTTRPALRPPSAARSPGTTWSPTWVTPYWPK